MYTLNTKIKDLVPYQPISGEYSVRLDANESFLNPGEELKKQITDKIAGLQLKRYPDALCTSLIQKFSSYYGVSPACVSASNGSDEMISILLGSFLERGSTVLTLSPDFSMYRFYCEVYEHKSITLKKDDDFLITPESIIEAANQNNVDMILFSNPCNPTSVGLPKAQILKIITSVSALVVIDEAYMEFFNDSVLPDLPQYDNLIVMKTCSKAIGSAAIRLGFAVASEKITRAVFAVKSPYNVNSITQAVGEALFENKNYIQNAISQILIQRDTMYLSLLQMQKKHAGLERIYKSDTNFITVKCKDAKAIWQALLEKSVAVRFTEGFLRITAGNGEEQKLFLEALQSILTEREQS
jgi:histidinol-phosphate aminotransferase